MLIDGETRWTDHPEQPHTHWEIKVHKKTEITLSLIKVMRNKTMTEVGCKKCIIPLRKLIYKALVRNIITFINWW